jgi:hypothetical protein
VPIGSSHVNAYSTGGEDLLMRHSFEPASDFALAYAQTLGHLMRVGASDKQGEVPVLAAFALGHATSARHTQRACPRRCSAGCCFRLALHSAGCVGTSCICPMPVGLRAERLPALDRFAEARRVADERPGVFEQDVVALMDEPVETAKRTVALDPDLLGKRMCGGLAPDVGGQVSD